MEAKADGETVGRCSSCSGIGTLVGSAGDLGSVKDIRWLRLGRLERLPQGSDVSAELDTGSQRKCLWGKKAQVCVVGRSTVGCTEALS